MEHWINSAAGVIALFLEVAAVLLIAFGAAEAVWGLFHLPPEEKRSHRPQKTVYLRFAGWLLMGLEFALAADIVNTVIAPTWQDIGQLAAIAAIRTFLNYFLERDMENHERREGDMTRG
jgi:uncharacterized membrane protein